MYLRNWLLITALAGIGFGQISCDNRQQGKESKEVASGKMPKITFDEKGIYDFGTLTEGDTVEHVFAFKNTGEFPLIINNITASCGCTTPEWPHEPVAPGEKSSVKVRFNSRGKSGEQSKTITIFANTEPSMTDLHFKALVNSKADSAKN
ncbi:DUF1573 domain-containing protein [Spirosoma sp. KCTC 42546]|uniref:DUF1573 domain-containing protein n=1 Tax=Spirosoma sp. KCTC 42546 TaxID=2520506 RepID=UPI00115817DF|nr:DUF1573 domain-containing protein [Spirosoma sp. KCTC 42546]QDK78251.1 DUF1573 domain-containing protein [Spirosoma sp. KCTC 42546]